MIAARTENGTPSITMLTERQHDSMQAAETTGDGWHAEERVEGAAETTGLTGRWVRVQDRDGRDRIELRWEVEEEYHRAAS